MTCWAASSGVQFSVSTTRSGFSGASYGSDTPVKLSISPYKEARDKNRALIGEFVEVYVHATIEELAEHRDPKGLYKKALAGEIEHFTGVDDPYEVPESPELRIDTMVEDPEGSLQHVLDALRDRGYIDDAAMLVEGDRVHSGLTDLRVTGTGHVAKEA